MKKLEFKSLKIKINFFILTLVFISFVVFSLTFIFSERKNLQEDIVKSGEMFASFSSKIIYDNYVRYYTHNTLGEFEEFKKNIKEILDNNTDVVGVKLVGVNGKILFDSSEISLGKYQGLDRIIEDRDLLDLIRKNEISNVTISENKKNFTEIINPIFLQSGGSHIFSTIYVISQDSLSQRMREVYLQILYVAIPIFIIIAILTILFVSRLLKPIKNLTKVAEKVRSGDLDIKVDVSSRDEIGVLSRVFGEMVLKIKESQSILEKKVKDRTEELEKERGNLESRVKERTLELESLKDNLEDLVKERTEKLNDKLSELERINKLMVNRELKMIELKKEIEGLKNNGQIIN